MNCTFLPIAEATNWYRCTRCKIRVPSKTGKIFCECRTPPSYWRRMRNFLTAMWTWAKDWFRLASAREQKRRLAICKKCNYFNGTTCGHQDCGCFTKFKTRIESQHCPLKPPKW